MNTLTSHFCISPRLLWKDYTPGSPIFYGLYPHAIGEMRLSATAEGICTLEVAQQEEEAWLQQMEKDFGVRPQCDPQKTAVGWRQLTQKNPLAPLPLVLQGTPFQKKVWKKLATIPYGDQVTYGALAQQLDLPTGARAVARAVAANRLVYVIPCHRVIRGDGHLGGFRWGLPLKAQWLQEEQTHAHLSL